MTSEQVAKIDILVSQCETEYRVFPRDIKEMFYYEVCQIKKGFGSLAESIAIDGALANCKRYLEEALDGWKAWKKEAGGME